MANHNITITATDKTKKTLQDVDRGLDKATRRSLMLKGALGLAAGALAALGVASAAKKVIDDMDNLAKRARNVGITSERSFAKFQVASKLLEEGGLSIEEVDRAMRNLSGRMAAGLAGNKQYAEIMTKLGGSIFDVNGKLKDTPDLFTAVAQGIQDGTIKMEDAQKILGEMVGPKILGIFNQLREDGVSVGAAMKEVAKSMNIVSIEDSNRAEQFNDALGRLSDSLTYLMQEALIPILPAMTTFVQDLAAKAPGYLESFKEGLAKLQPLFDFLGTVLNDVILPVLDRLFSILGKVFEVMKPIYEAALPLLQAGFELIFDVIEGVVATLEKFAPNIEAAVKDISRIGTDIIASFGDIKEKVSKLTEETVNTVKELWHGAWDYLVGNSIVPELKEDILKEFDEMDKGVTTSVKATTESVMSDYERLAEVMKDKTKEIKDTQEDFMKTFSEDFNTTFADALVEGNLNFDSFAGLFKSTMKDLIADTLNGGNKLNDILGSIGGMGGAGGGGFNLGGMFSGIGNWFSSAWSGLSSWFGGFFADGGYLPSGKIGIAGEAGPEIISGPARITPMNDMQTAGPGPAINITIQSIDTQTGTEFLLKNKKEIEGIIQNAYNRRGKQGIY